MSIGSIPPSGPPLSPRLSRRASARPADEGGNLSSSDAMRLQKDANDRATAVQNEINQINLEGQQNEDQLKQQYEQNYMAEGVRSEAAIEAEKTKGYEKLRAIQRQNQAEERRLQNQGESDITAIQERFRTEIPRARAAGENELREVQTSSTQQQQYERARSEDDLQALKKDHETRTTTLRETNEERLARLQADYQKRYEEKKTTTELATQTAAKKIEDRHNRVIAEHLQAENRIARESKRQLDSLRADTSKKLAAYHDRQSDPFYRMVTLNADFSEERDQYVLMAKVPEFEQPLVKVSISGNQLILSGQRRSEDKLELGPGRSQSTSSYQSFAETFPIPSPVDANQLTRESHGDILKITIPKKANPFAQAPKPTPEAQEVRRATVEKPHFPENLPHVEKDEPAPVAANRRDEPPPPEGASPGSGTLS
ncbi:MAG: Hsp20/alpha crystallin family protein [Oligoflexia bacterium]|nr:Hsp20/alpha crystallin family protein [Oligoflexia bacterium]